MLIMKKKLKKLEQQHGVSLSTEGIPSSADMERRKKSLQKIVWEI